MLFNWKVLLRCLRKWKKTVYEVKISKNHKTGVYVQEILNVSKLLNKVWHFWNVKVTCQTLSVIEIMISIACADTLYSFN